MGSVLVSKQPTVSENRRRAVVLAVEFLNGVEQRATASCGQTRGSLRRKLASAVTFDYEGAPPQALLM
jgi:hypothetical protein